MQIIVDIRGREAIPVRSIPLTTDWETMWPDELADRLASGIALTAYRLEGGAVKTIAPRWWKNETCRKLKALLTSVEAAQSSGAITEEEGALRWRNESLPLLPAGAFVWRDEFELQHTARDASGGLDVLDSPHSVAIKVGKETVVPESKHNRNVALNLEPFIESPELHKTIMAGFDQVPAVVAGVEQSWADHRRQQFLSRVLDPENVDMLQAVEAATDAAARRVLRGDLVELAEAPLPPDTLQAIIDGAETKDHLPDSEQALASAQVPMKRQAMVDKHLGTWGSIDADMSDGYRNGLSKAARASGGHGWYEERALAWARAKGKLREIPEEGAAPLSQAVHSMTKLPGHKHRL